MFKELPGWCSFWNFVFWIGLFSMLNTYNSHSGCNCGIGKQIVRELNLRGAKVYMLCRNEGRASQALHELVKVSNFIDFFMLYPFSPFHRIWCFFFHFGVFETLNKPLLFQLGCNAERLVEKIVDLSKFATIRAAVAEIEKGPTYLFLLLLYLYICYAKRSQEVFQTFLYFCVF